MVPSRPIEADVERVQQQMLADANSKREEAYARAPELNQNGRLKNQQLRNRGCEQEEDNTYPTKLTDFEKMLKQVFPSKYQPYIDKLTATTNGNTTELEGKDLEGNVPLDPNHASPLSRIWNKETQTVEIYLNLSKVEDVVKAGTDKLFNDVNLK